MCQPLVSVYVSPYITVYMTKPLSPFNSKGERNRWMGHVHRTRIRQISFDAHVVEERVKVYFS